MSFCVFFHRRRIYSHRQLNLHRSGYHMDREGALVREIDEAYIDQNKIARIEQFWEVAWRYRILLIRYVLRNKCRSFS